LPSQHCLRCRRAASEINILNGQAQDSRSGEQREPEHILRQWKGAARHRLHWRVVPCQAQPFYSLLPARWKRPLRPSPPLRRARYRSKSREMAHICERVPAITSGSPLPRNYSKGIENDLGRRASPGRGSLPPRLSFSGPLGCPPPPAEDHWRVGARTRHGNSIP